MSRIGSSITLSGCVALLAFLGHTQGTPLLWQDIRAGEFCLSIPQGLNDHTAAVREGVAEEFADVVVIGCWASFPDPWFGEGAGIAFMGLLIEGETFNNENIELLGIPAGATLHKRWDGLVAGNPGIWSIYEYVENGIRNRLWIAYDQIPSRRDGFHLVLIGFARQPTPDTDALIGEILMSVAPCCRAFTTPCTILVRPGESIQAAIDAAPEGAVICLEAGEWEEHVTIGHSVTLRGSESGSTIHGFKRNDPVITIKPEGERQILVELDRVTVTGATEAAGIWIGGFSKARILRSNVTRNGTGIWTSQDAQIWIMESSIRWNKNEGIVIMDTSQAHILGSLIAGNGGTGIVSWEGSVLRVMSSIVSGNQGSGIFLGSASESTVAGSLVQGNGDAGIVLVGSAVLRVDRTELKQNGTFGIAFFEDCMMSAADSDLLATAWSTIRFAGSVAGAGNAIPGPCETDANIAGSMCPGDLAFLVTQEGGKLDWTAKPLESFLYLFAPEYVGCGRVTINGVFRSDVDGPPEWDWGDGTLTQGWFPQSHRYSSAGVYTVIVSVGQLTQSVTVVIEDTAGPGCATESDEG